MDKKRRTKHIVEVVLILGVCFFLTQLGLAGRFLYGAAAQERSTYSIVAVDPVTGDVGIAGASCVPISAGGMTTLVPGKGAAATQAAFTLQNQAKVFDLLRQGATASEIIEFVSDDSYDADVEIRQYGVVTLNEGIIQVAGFTGKENNDWAGDQQDSTVAVSVQGNTWRMPRLFQMPWLLTQKRRSVPLNFQTVYCAPWRQRLPLEAIVAATRWASSRLHRLLSLRLQKLTSYLSLRL